MKPPTEKAVAKELKKIVDALKAYRPKRVVLFGSFARGEAHGLSDIDLLIIKETPKKFVERTAEVLDMCDSTIPIEPLVYTPTEIEQLLREENSFICEALKEGRVLYDEAQERG